MIGAGTAPRPWQTQTPSPTKIQLLGHTVWSVITPTQISTRIVLPGYTVLSLEDLHSFLESVTGRIPVTLLSRDLHLPYCPLLRVDPSVYPLGRFLLVVRSLAPPAVPAHARGRQVAQSEEFVARSVAMALAGELAATADIDKIPSFDHAGYSRSQSIWRFSHLSRGYLVLEHYTPTCPGLISRLSGAGVHRDAV